MGDVEAIARLHRQKVTSKYAADKVETLFPFYIFKK